MFGNRPRTEMNQPRVHTYLHIYIYCVKKSNATNSSQTGCSRIIIYGFELLLSCSDGTASFDIVTKKSHIEHLIAYKKKLYSSSVELIVGPVPINSVCPKGT